MTKNFYDLGISMIIAIQSLGEWLTTPMRLLSLLGNELFFLLIAPIVFWCMDAAAGLRLGLFLMTSASIFSFFKLIFHTPRPYWYTREVQAFSSETSFGLPSGHAQNSVVFWGTLAQYFRTRVAWLIAVGLILLIGLSRMYLAVHFPFDVLVGWGIGALLLWGMFKLERALLPRIKGLGLAAQIGISLATSLGMILLAYLARLALGTWEIPTEWIENALVAFPDEPITPLALSGVVSSAAAFFGMAAGGFLLYRSGWYDSTGPAGKLALRYLLGLFGMVVIYFGLGSIFPHGEDLVPLILRFIRYGLVGFWVTALAPLLFLRLGLASRPDST